MDPAELDVAGGKAYEHGICGTAQNAEHDAGESHADEGANDECCSGGIVEACEFVAIKFFNDQTKEPGT